MSDSTRRHVVLLSTGFGDWVAPLANALTALADVTLMLPQSEVDTLRPLLHPDLQLLPFQMPRLRQPLKQVRMCWTVVTRIIRVRPDVIHLQQGHLWLNLALPLLRRFPLVVTVHDHTAHLGDRLSRKTPQVLMNVAFRRADEVIVHTQTSGRYLALLRGIPKDRIHVVGLPVPIHALDESSVATPADSEGDGSVLFFGRIWPYKGLDVLIRAEPLISAEVPDARFVIAGEGEPIDRYRAMMVHPDRFTVINEYVSTATRGKLFRQASVVVLPYVEATQSGVVPLAYAFAKPVVATTVGGLPDTVEDGRTGFLVPPGDERALAGAVVRLLKDAALRRRCGEAGRRKVEEEASSERIALQTVVVYEAARRRYARRGGERPTRLQSGRYSPMTKTASSATTGPTDTEGRSRTTGAAGRPGLRLALGDRASGLTSRLSRQNDLAARAALYLRRSRVLIGLTRAAATAPLRMLDDTRPDTWEFSAFSFAGEDGILDFLSRRMAEPEHSFVEIGSSDGIANNTAWLAIARKWRGLMVEGDPAQAERARRVQEWFNPLVRVLPLMVTAETVEAVLQASPSLRPDIFSLDVDGIDLSLAQALFAQGFRPGICVVEYNSAFGPERRCAVDPALAYSSETPLYYGVSIQAWRSFFSSQGYRFISVEHSGVNAFFVDEARFDGRFLQDIRTREFAENLTQQQRFGGTWREQYEHIDGIPVVEAD